MTAPNWSTVHMSTKTWWMKWMMKWWYPSYHGVQENKLPTTTPNKVNLTNNAEQKKPYTADYAQYHFNGLP